MVHPNTGLSGRNGHIPRFLTLNSQNTTLYRDTASSLSFPPRPLSELY